MRQLLFFLCLSFSGINYAQTLKGVVRDSLTNEPLPFVNILFNNTKLGISSDANGNFETNYACSQIQISYVGYKSKTVDITEQGFVEVLLSPSTEKLAEIVVLPGINPAHRIVENAYQNREKNDPKNLLKFQYETYSRIFASADSVPDNIDSTFVEKRLGRGKDTSYYKPDSSSYDLKKYLEDHYLFYSETVTRRRYSKPRDNEEVLAQRTSGFNSPLFALVAVQFQNLNLDEDFINIAGLRYANPVAKNSTERYFFVLNDTVINERGDTTFYMSFRSNANAHIRGLKGVLAINTGSWAIENFRARPVSENSINSLYLVQQSQPFGGAWFPVILEVNLKMPIDSGTRGNTLINFKRSINNIDVNADDFSLRDIGKDEFTISRKAIKEADSILAKYRTEELDSLALNTYAYLDSLGEAENFDRSLNLFWALNNGYLPLGKVDFKLTSLLKINQFEGLRLGAGFRTNSKFSEILKVKVYGGYGFRDELWKYKFGVDIKPTKSNDFILYADWQKELYETGQIEFVQSNVVNILEDNYRQVFGPEWDYVRRYAGGLKLEPFKHFTTDLSLRREQRRFLGTYRYIDDNNQETEHFSNTEIVLAANYAPGTQTAKMFDQEILLQKPSFSVSGQLRQTLDIFQNSQSYTQLTLQADWLKRYANGHKLDVEFLAGELFGQAAASKLFTGQAGMQDEAGFFARNGGLGSLHAFETMRYFEFLNDRYSSLSIRYDFGKLFNPAKEFNPKWVLVHRMALGSLKNGERHLGYDFRDLEQGYFESGFECNRIIKEFAIFGLGIGAYYRYGHYANPNWDQNLAVKITSRIGF